jgi:hypothetical protein
VIKTIRLLNKTYNKYITRNCNKADLPLSLILKRQHFYPHIPYSAKFGDKVGQKFQLANKNIFQFWKEFKKKFNKTQT